MHIISSRHMLKKYIFHAKISIKFYQYTALIIYCECIHTNIYKYITLVLIHIFLFAQLLMQICFNICSICNISMEMLRYKLIPTQICIQAPAPTVRLRIRHATLFDAHSNSAVTYTPWHTFRYYIYYDFSIIGICMQIKSIRRKYVI